MLRAFACLGIVLAGGSGLWAACSSGSKADGTCPTGSETCPCFGNDTCNAGLICASDRCVNPGGGGAGGGGGGGIGGGGGGGGGGTAGAAGTTGGTGGGGDTAGAAGTTGGTGGGGGTAGAAGTTGGSGGTGGTAGGAGQGGTGGGTPTACDVTRPFGTPILAPGLNGATADDGNARLTADERTVYFYSNRAPGYRIYMGTRASRTDPFSGLQVIEGINAGAGGVLKFPTVTADAQTIFFESDPGGTFKIMVATRASVAAQFSASAPVAVVNAGPNDSQPFVLPDGSALYFMSTRGGTADLYRAARGTAGQFTTPTQVSTINTPSVEYTPVTTPDELVLYYASDRTDAGAKGHYDIWMSKRASASAAFEPPVNVQELNTAAYEAPSWISPDRCRIYFDRAGATGEKIYVAERAP